MARKTYTPDQRAEAIALSRIIGAREAGRQLGIDWRTVRSWAMDAGDAPDKAVDKASWSALMDVALAKVTSMVASGRLSPTTTATIAGIAARNRDREPPPEPDPESTPASRWADWLEGAVAQRADLAKRFPDPVSVVYRDAIRRLEAAPPDEPFDLEGWFATYDHDVEHDWAVERRARLNEEAARLNAASLAKHTVTAPPKPQLDPEAAALLAEADAILKGLRHE